MTVKREANMSGITRNMGLAAGLAMTLVMAGCAGQLQHLVPLNKDLSPEDLQYAKGIKSDSRDSYRSRWFPPFYMDAETIQPMNEGKKVCASRSATAPALLPSVGGNCVATVVYDGATGKRDCAIRETSFFLIFTWMHWREFPADAPSHIKAWDFGLLANSTGFGANHEGGFGKFLWLRFGPGRNVRVDDPLREADSGSPLDLPPAPIKAPAPGGG